MKKGLLALAASAALFVTATAALAADGSSYRDPGSDTTYVELSDGSGGYISLEGTDRRCGGRGASYDGMASLINGNLSDYWIVRRCDNGAVRLHVEGYINGEFWTGESAYFPN